MDDAVVHTIALYTCKRRHFYMHYGVITRITVSSCGRFRPGGQFNPLLTNDTFVVMAVGVVVPVVNTVIPYDWKFSRLKFFAVS